jgi:hypothetical protein
MFAAFRGGTRERFVGARGEKLALSATVRNIRAKPGRRMKFTPYRETLDANLSRRPDFLARRK